MVNNNNITAFPVQHYHMQIQWPIEYSVIDSYSDILSTSLSTVLGFLDQGNDEVCTVLKENIKPHDKVFQLFVKDIITPGLVGGYYINAMWVFNDVDY